MTQKETKRAKLDQLVESINDSRDSLSSIKNVTSGIVRIISDPGSSAKDLKELIEIDPPLTAKVLKLANSAYYSPGKRIGEIGQAIITIGFDAVKELALSQKVCEIFDKDESLAGYSRMLLWKHSISVALLGKMIYRREFGERGENIYAAGVLHDIGLIVEDQFLQDRFKEILMRSTMQEKNLPQLERRVLGYNHTDIGRVIAADWNFPRELSAAIGYHHTPDRAKQKFARIAATLYIAECLSASCEIGYADTRFIDESLFQDCVQEWDLSAHGLDLIVAEMKQEMARMESQGLLT